MKNKIIILFPIVILVGLLSFMAYIQWIANKDCRNLENISNNSELVDAIYNSIYSTIESSENIFENNIRWTVSAKDVDGNFNIDWEKLGIPLDIATIEFTGKDLGKDVFDKRLVKEVRVGYGYRKHLVYSVDDGFVRGAKYSIHVDCRND